MERLSEYQLCVEAIREFPWFQRFDPASINTPRSRQHKLKREIGTSGTRVIKANEISFCIWKVSNIIKYKII